MQPRSSAGVSTGGPRTVGMTSWRLRLLTSSRRSSARRLAATDLPVVHVVVGIERFLLGPHGFRHMLQVDANARPGAEAAPHRVDEHVRRLQVSGSFGVTRFPAFDAGKCGGLV